MSMNRQYGVAISDLIAKLRLKYPEHAEAFELLQNSLNDAWQVISDLDDQVTSATTINYIPIEYGANSALMGILAGVTQAVGLELVVKLAHTLTGGAPNTMQLNAGPAVAIKSHYDPAVDIATGYVVGSTIFLYFDGTVYLDMSQ